MNEGATLEGLAGQIDALRRENARRLEALEVENARLRDELAALKGSGKNGGVGTGKAESGLSPDRGQMSRGRLLRNAGAAAVGAVAAGAFSQGAIREARADHHGPGINVDFVNAHRDGANRIALRGDAPDGFGVRGSGRNGVLGVSNVANYAATAGRHDGNGVGVVGDTKSLTYSGVLGRNPNGVGVRGDGNNYGVMGTTAVRDPNVVGVFGESRNGGIGVRGRGRVGVEGRGSDDGNGSGVSGYGNVGVYGQSGVQGEAGVFGEHVGDIMGTAGHGVLGEGWGSGHAGVLGRNGTGTGVRGEHTGTAGTGVSGEGRGNEHFGVLGKNNSGTGVWGESGERGYCGVVGKHAGEGYGVLGEGNGPGFSGVVGRNPFGYGGQFSGGLAQLWLQPSTGTGQPSAGAHVKGELYMDSNADLFVCTTGGTPGTWRRFTTA